MAALAENFNRIDKNAVANVADSTPPNVLIEEDGDSRDSGISMGENVEIEREIGAGKMCENAATIPRQALVDCSNLVTKAIVNNSSRNSSMYHSDTPTGRKTRSLYNADSLDKSEYEKHNMQEKVLSRNESTASELSSMSRKRNSNSSSTTAWKKKRSKQMLVDNDEDLSDDDVFSMFDPSEQMPMIPASVSLWDVSLAQHKSMMNFHNKNNSEDSLNDSFQNVNGQTVLCRAMSVGYIDTFTKPSLPSMLEVQYSLPSVDKPQKESQAYRSISPMVLFSEFERLKDDFHANYIIVDCRYPFEYKGGHVKGAINIYKEEELKSMFFPEDPLKIIKKRVPIFYCEFSQKRGPAMANTLRSFDRIRNELNYPHVEYPEIYLMDQGYKSLWQLEHCRSICEPCDYIPMDKPEFLPQLKSFRGARLRSNASTKSVSDLSVAGGGTGLRRSKRGLRKNSSVLSIHSRLSSAKSFGGDSFISFSEMNSEDNIFGLEPLDRSDSRKSVSAFELNSIGSEVDVDFHLNSVATESTSAVVEDESHAVKLAMKVDTPEFLQKIIVVTPNKDEGAEKGPHGTPRVCLDFSSISDTE